MTTRNRKIPRPFKFKGIGEGEIIEEAAEEYKTWAPAIQLLKFADGTPMLRLCYYTKNGRIAPRALSLNEEDMENLREALKKKPQVREFMQRLLHE